MKHNQQYVHGSNAEKLVRESKISEIKHKKQDEKVNSKTKRSKKIQSRKENKKL